MDVSSQGADFIIIGAGVFGAATAYFLTERRAGRVVLLERQSVASGATGWSSGIVRVHYTNEWESRLALTSLAMFRDWTDRVGGTCGYRRTGFMRIVGPQDRDNLRRNVAMLRSIGADVQLLEPEELVRRQSCLSPEGVGGAAYEPEGGFASGSDTALAFIARARDLGAIIRQGVTATRVRFKGGRVLGVETSDGFIAAGCVLVAAGAWSRTICAQAGVVVPIRPKLIRAGMIQHPPGAALDHMTVIDDSIGTYFRPGEAGHTEFGLRYQWDVEPSHGPIHVPASFVADGATFLVRRVPAFADAGVGRGWAAVDGFSPDGAPILGAVPHIEGLFVAVGASGTGFKISPGVGLGMAELLTQGHNQQVDLRPFALSRFQDGKPIDSPTDYRHRPSWRNEPLPQ